jgi:hypothetical protein
MLLPAVSVVLLLPGLQQFPSERPLTARQQSATITLAVIDLIPPVYGPA